MIFKFNYLGFEYKYLAIKKYLFTSYLSKIMTPINLKPPKNKSLIAKPSKLSDHPSFIRQALLIKR